MANVGENVVDSFYHALEPYEEFRLWQESWGDHDEFAARLEDWRALGSRGDNLASTLDLAAGALRKARVPGGFVLHHGWGRPFDWTGQCVVERGDTVDGGYIAVDNYGGLALFQPGECATVKGFVVDDNAIMDGGDLDILLLARTHQVGSFADLAAKWNATGNKREWYARINLVGDFQFAVSDDGSASDFQTFEDMTPVTATTPFAVRVVYDESAGTRTFYQYDFDDALAAARSGGKAAVALLTPTATETDSITPITLFNSDAPLSVGGRSLGSSHESFSVDEGSVIFYAEFEFEGGTVAFNPAADGALLADSFEDSTSGLTWESQTYATQVDWPTYVAASGVTRFDAAGDLLKIGLLPTFDGADAADTQTWFAAAQLDTHANWDRFVSSESDNADGCALMLWNIEGVAAVNFGDGSGVSITVNPYPTGSMNSMAMTLDDQVLSHYVGTAGFSDTTRDVSSETPTHTTLSIGANAYSPGTTTIDADFAAVVVTPEVLTEAELDALSRVSGVEVGGNRLIDDAEFQLAVAHDGSRAYDKKGKYVVERGDTDDVGYLAPDHTGELALFQPFQAGTLRGFSMAHDQALEGDDVSFLIVFECKDGASNERPFGKWNTTGNNREWKAQLAPGSTARVFVSPDGTNTTLTDQFTALGNLAADTWYALTWEFDRSAGETTWNSYDVDDVRAIINTHKSAADVWTAVAALTAEDTDPNSHTPLASFNGTAHLSLGGPAGGDNDSLSATESAPGPFRYAQINFDNGSVVFDPQRDASAFASTFVDSDSGLSWTAQDVSEQADWPSIVDGEVSFDGGDWLRLNYAPAVTDPTDTGNGWTITLRATPGAQGGSRFVYSTESADFDGFAIRRDGGDTAYDATAGGASTVTATAEPTGIVVGDEVLLIQVIDGTSQYFGASSDGFTAADSISSIGTITHVNLEIGARPYNDGLPWTGTLGEILIIERALVEEEFDALAAYYDL